MSQLQYFAYPGWGDTGRKDHYYNQAVRVGDRIEISGQGGWNRETLEIDSDVATQIDQAFENVDVTLKDAGGKGWSQVFRITTYSIDLNEEYQNAFVRNMRKWMPDHMPIWTELGVSKLGIPAMKVEIEVVAYDPKTE